MDIKTDVEGDKATLKIDGKLTVQSSPVLSVALEALPANVCDLDIDLSAVSYIASAGLRVLVSADKLALKRGGTMRLLHPRAEVLGVFELTGLSEVFTIVR